MGQYHCTPLMSRRQHLAVYVRVIGVEPQMILSPTALALLAS
jgi:hypothetical protein